MDMDDDFMGEPEFDLSHDQQSIVNAAITRAAEIGGEDFAGTNPLIAIMQWWQTHAPEHERAGISPEQSLTDACRRYLAEHSGQ
jgi:hypothetical protein